MPDNKGSDAVIRRAFNEMFNVPNNIDVESQIENWNPLINKIKKSIQHLPEKKRSKHITTTLANTKRCVKHITTILANEDCEHQKTFFLHLVRCIANTDFRDLIFTFMIENTLWKVDETVSMTSAENTIECILPPICYFASMGCNRAISALLSKNAAVDQEDIFGSTALLWAVQNSNMGTVKLLLERRADVAHQNKWGATALLLAAQNGHAEIVDLLQYKTEIDHKNNEEITALDLTAEIGCTETVKVFNEVQNKNVSEKIKAETQDGDSSKKAKTVGPISTKIIAAQPSPSLTRPSVIQQPQERRSVIHFAQSRQQSTYTNS